MILNAAEQSQFGDRDNESGRTLTVIYEVISGDRDAQDDTTASSSGDLKQDGKDRSGTGIDVKIYGKDQVFSPTATFDGNLVGWDGPNDPENPQNWSVPYKWWLTTICMIMTVSVTFASSAPTSTFHHISEDFHISREESYLITTMYLLGYVFGPLFWGPSSEVWGRRPIFCITMSSFTLLYLGQALAKNSATLFSTRFLSGFFAVVPLTNSAGVVADIWPAVGRGPATSLFTAATFLGPVLGPIVSGFIIDSPVSWRWVFWVMMIFAGSCTFLTILCLPETYTPVLLLKKAQKLRKADVVGNKNIYAAQEKQDWSLRALINRTLFRPFIMLSMEPILLLITAYMSIVYGLLYALFQAFPIIFRDIRGFDIHESGLIFVGVGIGTTVGPLIHMTTTTRWPQLVVKWKGYPPPEHLLVGAMYGSACFIIGTFWLGWTGAYPSIPWYVPAISTIFLGAGISLIFISFSCYLVETYLMYSASAFSANTMIRSIVGAIFPLFTVQMFTKMGVNWACTLIGIFGLIFAPSPFIFYKYGARIRGRSKFAPCKDLQIAKEIGEEH